MYYLKVTDQQGRNLTFIIGGNTRLGSIKNVYEKLSGETSRTIMLYDGKRIDCNHTPEKCEMERISEIEIYTQQTGG